MGSWDELKTALVLARIGTHAGAGEELGVTHTTVARRVRSLEAATGTRLFDRIDGRWVPTAAGEQVVRAAGDMEEAALGLDRSVLGRDARLAGPLHLTTIDMFYVLLADAFAAFRALCPEVSLEVSTPMKPVSLARREADIALRATNAPAEHLVGRKAARLEYALFGSAELLASRGTDPAALPWVGLRHGLGAHLTEERMRQVGDVEVAVRLDSLFTIRASVRAGMGIAFLPCAVGDPDPSLVRLREVEPDFGLDVWVLTHPDLRGNARVRALREHLCDAIGAQRDLWEGRRP